MLGWFRNRKNLRYTKDKPPEHSRCDLCFNDFHFPCRTNCGHWLCGTCVLRFSILMDDFRKFKCSECESQVYNLVPHSPVLIQPGRQVAEVLGEILQFNREHKKDVDLLQSVRRMPDILIDKLPFVYASSSLRLYNMLMQYMTSVCGQMKGLNSDYVKW
ncbi:E3 ubiquitin-protein ligase RNF170-like isoform X2 [Salvia splendens]|uniref:E3 ubiquitin-protein ligase RNF170-like isoform X2 n=1 Tax=Salvia splendens TaxID=180675 RepID=UPI001C269F97|nr:E3 ubiquitin-protein ligase RNF170-like isoform X2 [Salvia splendens]